MKVTYLDQNHWIKLSQAASRRPNDPEMAGVLDALAQARATRRVCLPLSFGHYVETRKRRDADQRYRLAQCMVEWSKGITIAPPHVVMRHEINVALARCFPGRVVVEPLQLLGFGIAHASGNPDLHRPMHWPPGAEELPAPILAAYEANCRAKGELFHLSGILQGRKRWEWRPLTDLRMERWFRDSLESWRGVQSQYTPAALDHDIDLMHLTDLDSMLQDALAHHGITRGEFAQLGESGQRGFLEDMLWQRADKHLIKQWAKSPHLRPKDSDLIDWAYLSVAVSYCDIVVTEKQMADLFKRDAFYTRATVCTHLRQLPALIA
jgi:hypothetical protein